MNTYGHALLSLLLLGLWPVFGKCILITVATAILCDLDGIYLLYKQKAFTLKKINFIIKNTHRIYQQNPSTAYINIFYLFHTLEFNLILLILAYLWPVFGFISLGFLFHIVIDVIYHRLTGMPVLRWLFFTEFLRVLRKSKKKPF